MALASALALPMPCIRNLQIPKQVLRSRIGSCFSSCHVGCILIAEVPGFTVAQQPRLAYQLRLLLSRFLQTFRGMRWQAVRSRQNTCRDGRTFRMEKNASKGTSRLPKVFRRIAAACWVAHEALPDAFRPRPAIIACYTRADECGDIDVHWAKIAHPEPQFVHP